jgi:hypothetical protein
VPHCSFNDTELTGNLFDRTSLLTQAHSLLIACISLGAADGNVPGELYSFPKHPLTRWL